MRCANCPNDALYEYQITDQTSIFYCNKCLPKFLEARKQAGLLKLTSEYKSAVNEGLKNISEEQIEVTEKQEVEDKPKKKPVKKKVEQVAHSS